MRAVSIVVAGQEYSCHTAAQFNRSIRAAFPITLRKKEKEAENRLAHCQRHYCFLRMQSVLSLVPDD